MAHAQGHDGDHTSRIRDAAVCRKGNLCAERFGAPREQSGRPGMQSLAQPDNDRSLMSALTFCVGWPRLVDWERLRCGESRCIDPHCEQKVARLDQSGATAILEAGAV